MNTDTMNLKASVDFTQLVRETHDVGLNKKVLCPFHDDRTPSCHVYKDGFHCFACGEHGDHIDWLKHVHQLTTAEAINALERRAGGSLLTRPRCSTFSPKTAPYKPVSAEVLAAHHRQADKLSHIPAAMAGRGFTLEDLRVLSFAASGEDAIFPVTGPNGSVLALKLRFARPQGGQRYRYVTPGHGTPAWCSPDLLEHDTVLLVEGELNGMACWLAAPHLAVMGIAGIGGAPHLHALEGRKVYVYADGDDPCRRACALWTAQALDAGASSVYAVAPWHADACEIAGYEGREALAGLLS